MYSASHIEYNNNDLLSLDVYSMLATMNSLIMFLDIDSQKVHNKRARNTVCDLLPLPHDNDIALSFSHYMCRHQHLAKMHQL